MVCIGKSKIQQEVVVSFLFNIVNLNEMVGIHVGTDFDRYPFVSIILMTKDEPTADQFQQFLNQYEGIFLEEMPAEMQIVLPQEESESQNHQTQSNHVH